MTFTIRTLILLVLTGAVVAGVGAEQSSLPAAATKTSAVLRGRPSKDPAPS